MSEKLKASEREIDKLQSRLIGAAMDKFCKDVDGDKEERPAGNAVEVLHPPTHRPTHRPANPLLSLLSQSRRLGTLRSGRHMTEAQWCRSNLRTDLKVTSAP